MKPNFETMNDAFCDLCGKKKLWLIKIDQKKKWQLIAGLICHECINDMGFVLGKAMKPENFSD